MGRAGRKEAIQQFLLPFYLSTLSETPVLCSRQDFLYFFFHLATGRLPLTTDLSTQDRDRKYRADHSRRVKPEIEIKYIQCQLPTLRLSK